MKEIFGSEEINIKISEIVDKIAADVSVAGDFAVIGIRSRGAVLGKRIHEQLVDKTGKEIQFGTLDITLYRDDFNQPQSDRPLQVRSTEIPFDINDKMVLLVDDVLNTGRSVRAALDAITDFGRPAVIRLAVLVDRGGREFPIQADYVGYKAQAQAGQLVKVRLVESDGKDTVFIKDKDE